MCNTPATWQALNIINPLGHMPQDTLRTALLPHASRDGVRRKVPVSGLGRKMLEWAGGGLALRTPRAMECVCGDRNDTLSTTTAFTTMRMVTTRRKVRYLPGLGEAGGRAGSWALQVQMLPAT